MWLNYGVNSDSILISIEDVPSGKIDLFCPYCGGQLVAKKGKIKQHHFAHLDATCQVVVTKKELPTLPLYDNFNIQLSGKALKLLQQLWQSCRQNNWEIPMSPDLKPLLQARVLQRKFNKHPIICEFTELGKIPVGALPLKEFNYLQEYLILQKLSHFEQQVERSQLINSAKLAEQLIDLRLYRAQLKRILVHQLYYLEINADGKCFNKIGVTQRTVEERMAEVERDLRSHFRSYKLKVLGVWQHRGNVELYFKHRYKLYNYRIGSLTEYYEFDSPEIASAVFNDLNSMEPKELTPVELAVLEEIEAS
ncbi:competence protein CoiA family protein [Oscillatoria laete-virens NRMC-F 0139]|nr:competence protein CoiA family protein [Oscillatoria laete-virens]MDI9634363.1 competence protein CoiA family protein [Geitlerinema splendidum]MDL5055385.1 competence protein CoiA family protein [Oscillatoria laete-virens NRMC-F 0139]